MFYAAVETDIGELFKVLRSDGRVGGKAVLSFLLGLSGYCSKSADPEMDWFAGLEKRSSVPLCQLLQPLLHCFYSGYWDFETDEYELFRRRAPDLSFTEAEFKETLHQVREKWGDLEAVFSGVRALTILLKEDKMSPSSWYDPRDTVLDFDALLRTLELASERKAHQVRIRFT